MALVIPSAATALSDGNQLYDWLKLKSQVDNSSQKTDWFHVGMGAGFVGGAADVLSSSNSICIPNGVNSMQLWDITLLYLETQPESRHMDASRLVFIEINEKIPCKQMKNFR